jgi:hypothetical protein
MSDKLLQSIILYEQTLFCPDMRTDIEGQSFYTSLIYVIHVCCNNNDTQLSANPDYQLYLFGS